MKQETIEKSKIVEKVFFNSKKISLENEKFSLKATVFVPKADLKKPQPKVCLTIDICNNKVRLVSAHPEDIVNALIDIKCWYEEIMNNAQLVLEKERDGPCNVKTAIKRKILRTQSLLNLNALCVK